MADHKLSSPMEIKENFLNQMGNDGNIELLFEHLNDVIFWVKDKNYRYVMGNGPLLKLCGLNNLDEIIGKKDIDFFPAGMSEKVVKDDNTVISGEKIIHNRLEIIHDENGKIDWYSTNKVPLYGKNGDIIGVAGTTRKTKINQILHDSGSELAISIKYIFENYQKSISIKELAKMSGFSSSQFVKKYNSMLQINPVQFIISIRVRAACDLLITTKDSLSNISNDCGFYDQSSFTRQFKSCIGMAPSHYRQKYSK